MTTPNTGLAQGGVNEDIRHQIDHRPQDIQVITAIAHVKVVHCNLSP